MPDFIENHAVQINHSGFMGAVNELEHLVETNVSENDLQKHIEVHPYILSQQFSHCHHVFPKVALGVQYETDFMCLDIPSSGKEWIGIELESPQKKVITQKGRKTADLEHAIQQIRDWRAWITDNLSYARQNREQNGLGLIDISPRFFGHVIIGRRKNYNDKFNELRRQLLRDELIKVRSWDGIVEWARNRAQVFYRVSESFKLMKQQQNLIEKKDKYHKLKTLITEYRHAEELLNEKDKTLALLKEQYAKELSKFGSNLPEILIKKISKLLMENIPVVTIIKQVRDNIPDDMHESVLKEYISQIMLRDCRTKRYRPET